MSPFLSSNMHAPRPAFTLIELLLYIALSATTIIAAFHFMLTLSATRTEEGGRIILQQQLRLAADSITLSVRHAQQIDVSSSVFGTASGILALAMSGSMHPTVFSLSGGSVYAREGAQVGRITSRDLHIEELRFTLLTASGTFGTVQYSLQGRRLDPLSPDVLVIRSAVSLRQ